MIANINDCKLFINGRWEEADSASYIPIINPATEEVIAQVAEGAESDIDRAVEVSRKAFENGLWSTMDASDRGKILWKAGELIRENGDELARLESLNTGKSYSRCSGADVPFSAELFQYYAGWCTKIYGDTMPVRGNFLSYTLREPVGVVGAITPWNFPLILTCMKLCPALAAGNAVVIKPSEIAPLSVLKLMDILNEAGIPDGVVNVVTGYGKSAGHSLVRHPGIDKISFTGGTETGRNIVSGSAENLQMITLELGGKSPNIVCADADLDAAAFGAMWGCFANKGEMCTAGTRLFVERSIHKVFTKKVLELTKTLVPGDPFDEHTTLGPVISTQQLEKDLEYIERGKKEAELITGGKQYDMSGYFLQPTIFDQVDNSMKIAQDEIFGPVLSILEFSDLDEAVRLANDTVYGLAAAIWTKDIKKAHLAARKLKAGTVWINSYHKYDTSVPFGGYKLSGYGKELGKQSMDHYTQTKSVFVNLD
jgi:aldehyde dehydrogenase (NAD+)